MQDLATADGGRFQPLPGSAINLARSDDPLGALSPRDRQLFHEFGWGARLAPRFGTMIAAIEHQMATRPEAIAAWHEGESLSYGALDAAANRVARVLHAHGVRRGDAVCLYLQRSLPMLVGIVAAMRLGAAYVPQHVGVAPPAMLRHISSAVRARVILTLREMVHDVPVAGDQVLIALDQIMFDPALDGPRITGPDLSATPDDVAMILFTSGTTGTPNGVRVTHRNLCNILQTAPGDLGMRPGLRVGQILSIAFDMAAWETLGALSNGATLMIRGRSIQETAEQVDILIATPSILASLDADRCRQVKRVAVAGEPCPRPLADHWAAFCDFINSCGPTETTIINTAESHHPAKRHLSIGRPTPNNTVYVLDEALRPLPIGEKGEMWAGGDCVTAGYLGNPALTDERYRPDPFRPGHLMFRTRDLGRWTSSGELEHFGRVDDLVKIRGFRVELDAVSAALETVPGCQQAVTLKLDSRNLVSFVTPGGIDPAEAQAAVAAALPYYCVPAQVLAMEALPRTPRGKLDKRALMDLAARQGAAATPEAAE